MNQTTDMPKTHVLVIADMVDVAERLAGDVLPGAGYTASTADALSPHEDCDIILVDVTQLRSSPLAGLQTQRNFGNEAPAILVAPRLTSDMAGEVFELDIRDFIRKPASDEELLEHLSQFAEHVRQEQGRAELERQLKSAESVLRRRIEEMTALSRIGRAITSSNDMDTILKRVTEAAMYLTRADAVVIYLLGKAGGSLELRAHKGIAEDHISVLWHPSGDSVVATVMETGEPVARSNSEETTKFTTGYYVRASLSVPVITAQRVIGVLAAMRRAGAPFDDADRAALVNLGDFAGLAVGRVRERAEHEERLTEALATARLVGGHAETLINPIEGISSNVEALLDGEFGPLEDPQRDAASRIRLGVIRMDEIVTLIQMALAQFEEESPQAE